MIVTGIKTPLLTAQSDLHQVIYQALLDSGVEIKENSVLVIASKLFSTTENRFVEKKENTRQEKHNLVKQEAEYYTEPHSSKYDLMLTIKHNMLFVNAGLDESNAGGDKYLLWPENPQQSLNQLWEFLREKLNIKNLGLIMSDSSSFPLNWGVVGRAVVHCGFYPLKSYIGKKDLFGRELKMEQTNMMESLADAGSLEMGEGNEKKPLALIIDIPDLKFQNRVPTTEELDYLHIKLEDDAYAPILSKADWKKGDQ
jgi:F420-0:gamma-glutamyl ligase